MGPSPKTLVCFCLWAALLLPVRLEGQGAPTGSILGTVTDPAGALVAGATVSVTNEATGIGHTMKTNSLGRYEFTALPVGNYRIRATQVGFSTTEIPHIVLKVAAQYLADLALKVGEVTQVVEVEATAPLLQTESNMVAQVVENRTLVEVPLNGRDYQQLQLLTPGVVSGFNFQTTIGLGGGTSIGGPSQTSNIVNGMRSTATSFLMDGGDTSNQAFRTTQFVPPIDAVAEFNQI
ncbi:MAG: carboxypeptidase regulatory-like domain-containing protein [Acidobacteria bacterium]|nr:carboxypeptidase regulatory-like domain-containing protein [Acidobacteriota bacterium]